MAPNNKGSRTIAWIASNRDLGHIRRSYNCLVVLGLITMLQDLDPTEHSPRPWPQSTDPYKIEFIRDFATYLKENYNVENADLERAIQAQKQTDQRFDIVLTELGLISEKNLMSAISNYFQIPVIAPDTFPVSPVLEKHLDADFVKRNRLLPLTDETDKIIIAVADPFNASAIAAISYLTEKEVVAKLALGRDIDAAISLIYASNEEVVDEAWQEPEAGNYINDDDIQRLHDIGSEAPIIRLVNRIIGAAKEQRASDIHIEPVASDVRVRFRIDGVMTEVERLPSELHPGVTSRIKIISKLNIAERRMPQDGRTKFIIGGREVDLRVSTMPTFHGESVVIRLLDKDSVDLSFEALGFNLGSCATLEKLLKAPNGIMLLTGPTGSGKTTTLYAALRLLNSVERKVFTIEDPIEYQLGGVNQIQIQPSIGLDFVHCLRSVLRQDPDVIMVGEMRDSETARIGVQASLTGHLVLSTLHTNSAASAVTRLLDMGVEDYLLSSCLTGIIAQRLVRKLCMDCAEICEGQEVRISELLRDLPNGVHLKQPAILKTPVGCSNCRNTGYNGRTSIIEVLVVDENIRQTMVKGTTDKEIEAAAISGGMESLYQHALIKALNGETSLDEVFRVTRGNNA